MPDGARTVAGGSHGVDAATAALHQALARALDLIGAAARRGALPANLRLRLVQASGGVAAQRDALARISAALDRAIGILLPREATVYDRGGAAAVPACSGSARA